MHRALSALALLAAHASCAWAQDPPPYYEKTCFTCHEFGAGGAPRTQNADDWAPRVAKGMEALLQSVKNGLNAMPPGGMCFTCDDDDYRALIRYMSGLEQAGPRPEVDKSLLALLLTQEQDTGESDGGGGGGNGGGGGKPVDPPAARCVAGEAYEPIVKVVPIYPRRAQARGITGYCEVEFTVTTIGATDSVLSKDCQPPGVFDRAAAKAATKFKYRPCVIDGVPREVKGVTHRFEFKLE